MLQIAKIACTNNAAFVMNFSIRWLDHAGNWHLSEWNSGDYAINQTRTSPDLISIDVPSDARAIAPYVHALLGEHRTGAPMVSYSANNQVAAYEVKGTTSDYSVDLIR
ncbi:MAG TPA: hypothetical protein VGD58_16220 [Herpetosiphonaceae bacterium]